MTPKEEFRLDRGKKLPRLFSYIHDHRDAVIFAIGLIAWLAMVLVTVFVTRDACV